MNTTVVDTSVIADAMKTLLAELVLGAGETTFMLNGGDIGLLRSLDKLSAADASHSSHAGATVAAHADHVRYGLSLMNRWTGGEENPFADADWSQSWRISSVSEDAWHSIRDGLRTESERWLTTVGTPRDMTSLQLKGMMGSIAHLAYHLGAMRQIERSLRGPKDSESN